MEKFFPHRTRELSNEEARQEGRARGSLDSALLWPDCPSSPSDPHGIPGAPQLRNATIQGEKKTGSLLRNGELYSWVFEDFLPGAPRPCPRAGTVTMADGPGTRGEPLPSGNRHGYCGNGTGTQPGTFFSNTIELLSLATSIWNKSASRLQSFPQKSPMSSNGKSTAMCLSPQTEALRAELTCAGHLLWGGPWLTRSIEPPPKPNAHARSSETDPRGAETIVCAETGNRKQQRVWLLRCGAWAFQAAWI